MGELRIAVIGAGMAGIASVIKLREAGIDDVTVFEKAHDVGGTWRENIYPGIACDVPSHLYSYSFSPNADWTHTVSPGDEIQAYFQVARREGCTSGPASARRWCRSTTAAAGGRWPRRAGTRTTSTSSSPPPACSTTPTSPSCPGWSPFADQFANAVIAADSPAMAIIEEACRTHLETVAEPGLRKRLRPD